jgi:lactate dehydrogenase-like 2-hydroxyacid dehydrogenase
VRATLGHDPKGKVLGILGMGGIGRVSCAYRLQKCLRTLLTTVSLLRKWPSVPKLSA